MKTAVPENKTDARKSGRRVRLFRIAFDFFYDVGPFCDTGTETKASSGRMCTVQKHFKEMKKQKSQTETTTY